MKKQVIPVYLEERQHRILRRMAREEKVSISHLVRRGLDLLIQKVPAEKDPASQIIGIGSSGIADLGSAHDKYLVKELSKEGKKL